MPLRSWPFPAIPTPSLPWNPCQVNLTMRADSAAQCIQLMTQGERPAVRAAKVYLLMGSLSQAELDQIKRYLINPVECREAALDLPDTLRVSAASPAPRGDHIRLHRPGRSGPLRPCWTSWALPMDLEDLKFLQAYFRDTERRDPTLTEVRVVDTYWSDHCRHTTFSTHIDNVRIDHPEVQAAYERYLAARKRSTVRKSRNSPPDPDGHCHHWCQDAEKAGPAP